MILLRLEAVKLNFLLKLLFPYNRETMILFKKLIFALPFLIFYCAFLLVINPFLNNSNLLFSLEFQTLIQISLIEAFLLYTAIYFTIFVSFATNWKIVVSIVIVACLFPLLLVNPPLKVIITLGSLFSFMLTYLLLNKKLSNYITFHARTLLAPSIKHLITLLALTISFGFYLTTNSNISRNGFKLPDSLLDDSLKFATPQLSKENQTQLSLANHLQISQEELQLLKQNPESLTQFGLDPSIINTLDQTTLFESNKNSGVVNQNTVIKSIVQKQVEDLTKPYQHYIPFILALIFFITLQSYASLLSIILPLHLWLIFFILEKLGFIRYQIETREVKKLIV